MALGAPGDEERALYTECSSIDTGGPHLGTDPKRD